MLFTHISTVYQHHRNYIFSKSGMTLQ